MKKQQKPKELDCKIEIHKIIQKEVAGEMWYESHSLEEQMLRLLKNLELKLIDKFNALLTQQRTELENQKVKVVWNNVCEQIKRETVEETTGKVLSLATEKLIDLQTTNCSWKVIKWDDLFNIIKSIDNLQIKKGK